MTDQNGPPRNRKKITCYKFLDGSCSFGDSCRFSHEPDSKNTNGYRNTLSTFKLTHGVPEPEDKEHPVENNICFEFESKGECKRGKRCRFLHVTSNEYENLLQNGTNSRYRENSTREKLQRKQEERVLQDSSALDGFFKSDYNSPALLTELEPARDADDAAESSNENQNLTDMYLDPTESLQVNVRSDRHENKKKQQQLLSILRRQDVSRDPVDHESGNLIEPGPQATTDANSRDLLTRDVTPPFPLTVTSAASSLQHITVSRAGNTSWQESRNTNVIDHLSGSLRSNLSGILSPPPLYVTRLRHVMLCYVVFCYDWLQMIFTS